jgi:hypothetical protein
MTESLPSFGHNSGAPEIRLALEILDELIRARQKFRGDNVTTLALVEKVGKLAQATFEKSRAEVRKEAIQVACMAMRVVLDGDATLDDWRAKRGLDALVETTSVGQGGDPSRCSK